MSDGKYDLVSIEHGVSESGKAFSGKIKVVDGGEHWDVDVTLRRNDNDTVKGRFKMDVRMVNPSIEGSGSKYIFYVYEDLDHDREDVLYKDMMGDRLRMKWLQVIEMYVAHAVACGL